jgi:hypothetical protein
MNVTDVIDTIEREKSNFMILTSDKHLQELFSDLYSSKEVIKLPILFENFRPSTQFFRDLVLLPFYKRKILNICKKINPKKIMFYYIGWNGLESWLIKNLSRDVKIYHRPKVDMRSIKSNNSMRLVIKTFIASFIYGIRFKSASFHGYPMTVIDKSFLKLVDAQKYDHIFNPKNIEKFIDNRLKHSNIDVLLLVGGEYYLDLDKYSAAMKDIFSVLHKYYKPFNIGIKNHPHFPMFKNEWNEDFVILDSKLPANLLCYSSKVVIAYESSVLYEAADIGKSAISTLHIIPSKKNGEGDRVEKYLLDNSKSKNIYFPRSIDEFNDLLLAQIESDAQ